MIRDPSFPDIYMDGMKDNNPYIFSPNACYAIFFYQTRETLFGDADIFKKFIDLSYGTFAIVVCEHRNLICIKIKRKKCKNGMKNDTVLRKSSYLCIVKRQVGI